MIKINKPGVGQKWHKKIVLTYRCPGAPVKRGLRPPVLTAALAAAALLFLLAGSLIPAVRSFAAVPAGLCVAAVLAECGRLPALLCYAAASLFAAALLPDKLSALLFLLFFGNYPMVKSFCEALPRRRTEFAAKLTFFNAALLLFRLLAGTGGGWSALPESLPARLLIPVGLNAAFLLYDELLSLLYSLYLRLRRRRK